MHSKLPDNVVWITVDGPDRIGKTSVVNSAFPLLTSALASKWNVLLMPEVSDSHIGDAIRLLYDQGHFRLTNQNIEASLSDALLWFSEQYRNLSNQLNSIEGSTILLADRGPDSRRILQSTRLTMALGKHFSSQIDGWIADTIKFLPKPHKTFYISTPMDTIKERMNADVVYEKYMEHVKDRFDRLAAIESNRIIKLDGRDSIEVLAQNLVRHLSAIY